MKIEQANVIKEILESFDYEVSVNENYSGRGMYGKTTAAVYLPEGCSVATVLECVLESAQMVVDSGVDFSNTYLSQDNMGLGYVIY